MSAALPMHPHDRRCVECRVVSHFRAGDLIRKVPRCPACGSAFTDAVASEPVKRPAKKRPIRRRGA